MKRLLCFILGGHRIKALVSYQGGEPAGYVFYCTRCRSWLPGPRP